ncbi:clumping factor B [Magallana gigas]|uniref:clumping factor B n=1 Tax=Magallana gigas TaxID=29159 RepID=UPI00333ECBC7
MSSKTLSELMTIKTESPAIDNFDPTEAVNLWMLNPSGRKRRPNFCRGKQLQSGAQKRKRNPETENDTTTVAEKDTSTEVEKDTTAKTGKDTSAEMDDPEDTQDIESEYEEDTETDSDIEADSDVEQSEKENNRM